MSANANSPHTQIANRIIANPRIPRITTRHSYDLTNGRALHPRVTYRLYPKYFFDSVSGIAELIIMIHGLRNDEQDALQKTIIAQNMLRRLRPHSCPHHIVGFSYDSNTRGANINRYQKRALSAGKRIAKENGRHLAQFLLDFKKNESNHSTKIRLLGHSLGSEVIYHAIMHLASKSPTCAASKQPTTHQIIESVHFFGSSLPADIQHDQKVRDAIDHCIRDKLLNCYAPTDDVLRGAELNKLITGAGPLGLRGATLGNTTATAAKYRQRKLYPENHRFASYANALQSFPQ